MPARLRIPTFAIWESVTFVLNVLAFTLVGLQLRAVIEGLSSFQWARFLTAAIVILAVVIAVRLSWAMLASAVRRGVEAAAEGGSGTELTPKGGLVVGWSGMRGIVTLAAALALPESFPERDFIQFAAFAVVLGTLLVQGLTLGPLVRWLRFPKDETLPRELALARAAALKATLQALDHDHSPAAERAKRHYSEALGKAQSGFDPHETSDHAIRRRILPDARRALDHLRASGTIADGAFRAVEEELDLLELSSTRPQSETE
jgi:CPA1 family monovalent cation:H+ antiporter